MSIASIMNNGVKGMSSSQTATQVTSNNISNAATVGYTRRSAAITPGQTLTSPNRSARVLEPFIEKRMLGARSGAGEAKAERTALGVLDTVFAEGDGSIGSAMDAFQVSMQNLTSRPEDAAARQAVLSNANNLASAFGNANAQLEQARSDTNLRVTQGLSEVNQRLHQIANLGIEIQKAEIGGEEASEMRDQRDLLIGEVAERVPVTVLDQGHGQISLMLGGSHQLVTPDGKVGELTSKVGPDGGMRIQKSVAGAIVDVTNEVKSGSVGGQIQARAGALTEAQKKLDQLAYDVSSAYNGVHKQGFALDGTTNRNLFAEQLSVQGAAEAFAVSTDLEGDPAKIAAASSATSLPSDNRNALALSALSSAPVAVGGQTVIEALASLIGYAGGAVQNATQAESFSTGALEQVEALRQSTSGVSSDEEMVEMMKYQRAYQASLKVISVADQMMNDLLNIRG
jgi:flagellar hook-associated protein 1